MSTSITLTSAVRANLLALQNTTDNPPTTHTDPMTNGVNIIKAADNGLTSITTTIQSMQATVTQARQDASWQSGSYTLDSTTIGTSGLKTIGFSGGAVGATVVTVSLNDHETL